MHIFEHSSKKPRILVTGGAGFIGGAVIRKLLTDTECIIFNLDKMGYASDLTSIDHTLLSLGSGKEDRYFFLKVDLSNYSDTISAVNYADPDFIMHLAAESHVDRSIKGPDEFIKSNIVGTFNLLEAAKCHYDQLPNQRKTTFKFHHISTDEVFGTLGQKGKFNETSQYDPRSPYSASKASSDHLVNSWLHTYGLPTLITNCSNNYGPWQYPEKLIPKIIINALRNSEIPIYGDGKNIRDWLYVEDHADALLQVIENGDIGEKYCIGGNQEKSNNEIAEIICDCLDEICPSNNPYKKLITYVEDRQGHDFRYAIETNKINKKLNWYPKFNFKEGIRKTINWYLANKNWYFEVNEKKIK